MNRLLGLLLIPMLFGCSGILRDEVTYTAEVGFMGSASLQEAESIILLVGTYCRCDATGKFTTSDCAKAANRALVVQSRIPWHTAMMMYNARLATERPGEEPPVVPATSSLCPVESK